MCQCLCTNVTDVDVQIKSVPRLDSSADNALKAGESHFFEVRAVRQVNVMFYYLFRFFVKLKLLSKLGIWCQCF